MKSLYRVLRKLVCSHCRYKHKETQLLKLFIQIYYNNSHQHLVNVTTEISHSSMFTNSFTVFHKYLQYSLKILKITQNINTTQRTAGAVILQLVLKLQKGNNFPVIPILTEFTYDMIISFHQPGTGR